MNWIFILVFAISFEILTIFVRFAFKIKTKDVLVKIMKRFNMKKIIHFHHGFVGIIIFGIAYYLELGFWGDVGLGLLISDAIHHFLVLWPIMGNPEFHVLYKNIGEMQKEERLEKKKIGKVIEKISG